MGSSILEAGNNVGVRGDGSDVVDVSSAWVVAGRRGRIATGLAGASCIAVTLLWLAEAPAVVGTGLSLVVLVAAALVDAVDHRLPNILVGAAAIPVGVAAALALAAGSAGIAVGAAAGVAVLGVPLLLTHLVSPAGMGFGDVKAGVVLGAAVGLISAQIAVLTLMLALAGSAGWAVAHRRRTVALGPGLVAGALLALVVAKWIGLEAN